jgi:SAM-dependent methyltransferase
VQNTTAKLWLVSLLALSLWPAGCDRRDRDTPLSLGESRDHPPIAETSTNEAPVPPGRSRPAVIFVEFVATPNDVVDQMLKLAQVGPGDVVYDLGCGDGRIVVAAAKKYGCRAVGFELDRLRVREARENTARAGVAERVTIELKDALTVDLRPATVVTLYLGPELNARLIPQLQQLAPGSRIVSHDFGIEGFPPDETVRMTSRETNRDHLIYLWNGPLGKPK